MKIDIEGADLLCIEALTDFEDRSQRVSIESTKTSWPDMKREFALLRSLGYSRFKVVDQTEVHNQHCPSPAREGTYTDHHFEEGSSGLFGEEAPGEWLTEQEALRVYRGIWRYRLFGDGGALRKLSWRIRRIPLRRSVDWFEVGWYDTHATT